MKLITSWSSVSRLSRKMWEPQRHTTLWASTACNRDRFTFLCVYIVTYEGFAWRIITGLDWMFVLIDTSLRLQLILTDHSRWLPKTRSTPYWTTSVFPSTVTDFFSFRCPLVNTPQLNAQLLWLINSLTNEFRPPAPVRLRGEGEGERVTLRLAVYRQSVRFGASPLETHGQNFFNWSPTVLVLM
jgi:hypothetical protein